MTSIRDAELRLAAGLARWKTSRTYKTSRVASASIELRDAIAVAVLVRREIEPDAEYLDLKGECGRAAVTIAIRLLDPDALRMGYFLDGVGGRRAKEVLAWKARHPSDHAWCVVDDHVVDATATQFGDYPAIYVRPIAQAAQYVEIHRGVAAAEQMRTWDYHGWPRKLARLRALDVSP